MPLPLLALLSGCASNTVATVEPACLVLKPVCPTTADAISEPTARTVLGNNNATRSMCGDAWAKCQRQPRAPQSKPAAEVKTS